MKIFNFFLKKGNPWKNLTSHKKIPQFSHYPSFFALTMCKRHLQSQVKIVLKLNQEIKHRAQGKINNLGNFSLNKNNFRLTITVIATIMTAIYFHIFRNNILLLNYSWEVVSWRVRVAQWNMHVLKLHYEVS